jgi:phospholipid transport system substrate-binding protein
MKFKLLLLSCVFCLISGSLAAEPRGWPGAYPGRLQAPAQAEPSPAMLLSQGMGQLIKFLRRQPSPTAAEIAAYIDSQVAPYFDFAYMARWVAGSRYRYMNEQQRSAMEVSLKKMFLGALAQRLGGYGNQNVRFNKPRRVAANEVDVGVDILTPGTYPARLNFRFYRSENGWKVFDVSANGSSALVHYRQYFARMQRQSPRWG